MDVLDVLENDLNRDVIDYDLLNHQSPVYATLRPSRPARLTGASGPLELDDNSDSLIGAIEVWEVLACRESLFTIRQVHPAGADVNGDGNVNSIDAALILQFTAGLLNSL